MNQTAPLSILHIVSSDLDLDPRTIKEAESAREAGHHVEVVCRSAARRQAFAVHAVGAKKPAKRTTMRLLLKRVLFVIRVLRIRPHRRPDIVHAHDFDMLVPSWLLARYYGTPLVYDSHESWTDLDRGFPPLVLGVVRSFERFLARRADTVITVSQPLAELMAKNWGVEVPVVVHNALPRTVVPRPQERSRAASQQRAGLGIPPDARVVVFQGKFRDHSGLEQLILAAELLGERTHVVLHGFGPEEDKLAGLIRERELENRVHLAGSFQLKDVILKAAIGDIGVIPLLPLSPEEIYAAPNKMFEYIMAGLPIVGSDLPGLASVVTKERLGRLFDPTDITSIASTIEGVLTDALEYQKIRKRVVACQSRLTWESEYKKIDRLYRELTVDDASCGS